MAATTQMIVVRMPKHRGRNGPTWKINPRDTARIEELVAAGGVVISGYETKQEPKPAVKKTATKTDGKE